MRKHTVRYIAMFVLAALVGMGGAVRAADFGEGKFKFGAYKGLFPPGGGGYDRPAPAGGGGFDMQVAKGSGETTIAAPQPQ